MFATFSSLPWRWKLRLLNVAGMVYFFALTISAWVFGCFISIPEIYRNDPESLYSCRVTATFFFAQTLLNYFCLRYYSRHSKLNSENCALPKSVQGEENRVCRTCEIVSPPRAKHCPLCDVCVLKRDHHCFFGGCCVGFHNQRYFIIFCLYGSFGAIYSAYMTFGFLSIHYENVLSSQFYMFLMPWLIWNLITSQISLIVFAMVVYSYFSMFTFFACAYYFLFQSLLLYRGQTSYEFVKGIKRYRYSLLENLRSVFGPYWLLNLLLPLPLLKSVHNGFDWKIVHDWKQN